MCSKIAPQPCVYGESYLRWSVTLSFFFGVSKAFLACPREVCTFWRGLRPSTTLMNGVDLTGSSLVIL